MQNMQQSLPITNKRGRVYTLEEVERLVYELVAASLLDAMPSEKLRALDAALLQDDVALEEFLEKHIPHFKEVLERTHRRLALTS